MNLPPPVGLPSSWNLARAKFIFSEAQRPPHEDDSIVTAFRDGEVTKRENRRTEGFTNAIAETGYHGVRRGDLVIHSMDGFAGAIGVSDSDGKSSPVVHAYVGGHGIDPRFYAYLLRTYALSGYITSLAKGIRQRSTSFDRRTFGAMELPVPPPGVQARIADYLDRATARIDALVDTKRRLSGLLEEKSETLRYEAIAGVASRFESRPVIAACVRVVDCVNKTAPTINGESPYRMIRTSNVRNGSVDLTEVQYVDEPTFRKWNRRGAPRSGDILLTREAPLGEVGLLKNANNVFLGQRLVLYTPDPQLALGSYLLQALMSPMVQEQIELLGAGSLHPHLRVGDCTKLKLPLPPIAEQARLTSKLEPQLRTLEKAQTALGRQISLLSEYRQSLITEAVSGRMERTLAGAVPSGAVGS